MRRISTTTTILTTTVGTGETVIDLSTEMIATSLNPVLARHPGTPIGTGAFGTGITMTETVDTKIMLTDVPVIDRCYDRHCRLSPWRSVRSRSPRPEKAQLQSEEAVRQA